MLSTHSASAEAYNQFCGTQAKGHIEKLDQQSGHAEDIQSIEKYKRAYDESLARDTVSTGVKYLNQSFTESKDTSAALMLEMIKSTIENPSAKKFDDLCIPIKKIRLCELSADLKDDMQETFISLTIACSKTQCDKINSIKEIPKALTEFVSKISPDIIKNFSTMQPDYGTENDSERAAIKKKIADLQTPAFQDSEKLKRFIGEKYLRTCPIEKPDQAITTTCNSNGLPQIVDLSLSDKTFKILGVLSREKGEASVFSREEIKQYKDVCDRNNENKNFENICHEIDSEYDKSMAAKTTQDWEKIHKNNYVISDPTSKEGYRIVPKASNTEIFLSAAAPAIANFSNFWMWNIQSQSQIDIMGQQAILQRQYAYGYNYGYGYDYGYNNYNFGYFPANYMQPYTGTASLSTSVGFNFGL